MDQQMTPTLVIEHCLCNGCKRGFNTLKRKIPQVHSFFDTEQSAVIIFSAVDPATVMEELAEKGITPRIMWEKSSTINNRNQSGPSLSQSIRQLQSLFQAIRQPQSNFQPQSVPSIFQPQSVPSLPLLQSVASIVERTPDCYLNHKHELVQVRGFNKRFSCDGCKEDGFKSRYRCERCNFDLHFECRFPKLTISPEINEELVFEFRPQKPPKETICDACGKGIHGCFYNCNAKGMDLHPCCARLKAQVANHDMVLVLRKKVSSECLWCRKKQPPGTEKGIPGWCYVSQCKKYNIHMLCITKMLHQAWQRGLMDGTGENSIRNIDFQPMAVSHRNRGGRGSVVAWKIIGILRIVFGILLGDPSVFFGKLMFEFLEQLL